MTTSRTASETIVSTPVSLRLRQRPIDIFFVAIFSVFIVTGIISDSVEIVGVEFFGSTAERTPNPAVFLAFNLPYILVPLLRLIRMRKPLPFLRRF